MDLIDTLTVAGVVAMLFATAIGIALAVGGIQKRSMMEVIGAKMEIMDAQIKVLNDKTDGISKEIESLRQEYRADMKDVMSKLKVERN